MELAHALDYPGCLLRDEADDGVDGQGARALKVCLVAGAGAEAAAGGLGMARGGVEAARGGGGRCCPCGLLGGEDEGCGEGGGAGGGQALSYYGREGPCCGCESHGGGCGWLWSWCCRGEGEEGERGGAHDRLRWKLQGAQSRRQPGAAGIFRGVLFFREEERGPGAWRAATGFCGEDLASEHHLFLINTKSFPSISPRCYIKGWAPLSGSCLFALL